MVKSFLFWFVGVVIMGVIGVLLFRPERVSDITIAVLMITAAIGTYIAYRRDKED